MDIDIIFLLVEGDLDLLVAASYNYNSLYILSIIFYCYYFNEDSLWRNYISFIFCSSNSFCNLYFSFTILCSSSSIRITWEATGERWECSGDSVEWGFQRRSFWLSLLIFFWIFFSFVFCYTSLIFYLFFSRKFTFVFSFFFST